jgi:hypothetical protein
MAKTKPAVAPKEAETVEQAVAAVEAAEVPKPECSEAQAEKDAVSKKFAAMEAASLKSAHPDQKRHAEAVKAQYAARVAAQHAAIDAKYAKKS